MDRLQNAKEIQSKERVDGGKLMKEFILDSGSLVQD
jgi:hypothetical protein